MERQAEPEGGRDLRAALRAEMQTRGWSQALTAGRMEGVSQTTLNQWLSGKYPGDVGAVDAKVQRLLDSLSEGAKVVAARAVSPGFMRTDTAAQVWAMLAFAQHSPDMTVVAGAPGVGKTMTARGYQAAGSNVWIATMDPDLSTPTKMLVEIAAALSLPVRNNATVRREIGERINRSGGLIVVDEAQHLNRAALDMLRSLHDRYGVGVALLGNHGLFAGTSVSSASDGFAQFYSRVGMKRLFAAPKRSDVDQLLDAWSVTDREMRAYLARVAGQPGALRAVDKCLRAATTVAAGLGEPLTLRALKAAWEPGAGRDAA